MSRSKDDHGTAADRYGLPPGFYIDALHGMVDGKTVARIGAHACPSCGHSVSKMRDVRWLGCPLVRDLFICESCCRCFQGVARSSRFETHPDLSWFTNVAEKGSSVRANEARIQCATHALEMARAILRDHDHASGERAFYRDLIQRLEAITSNR